MTTQLEIANNKLNRLKEEQDGIMKAIRKEKDLIPFGQPVIIGRRDIYKDLKRYYGKSIANSVEQDKQKRRIEMLEKVEEVKNENSALKDVHVVGASGYATIGAKTSVNNLEYFKEKLVELEKRNEEAKAYNKTKPAVKKKTLGTEITKLKRKIQMLEEMKAKDENKVLSDHAQSLIDSGLVTQWQKKPIYYFVKGLRKVALVLNESGDFEKSKKYSAYSDKDIEFVEKLLKK
mgnify:CR=1 FL=1